MEFLRSRCCHGASMSVGHAAIVRSEKAIISPVRVSRAFTVSSKVTADSSARMRACVGCRVGDILPAMLAQQWKTRGAEAEVIRAIPIGEIVRRFATGLKRKFETSYCA